MAICRCCLSLLSDSQFLSLDSDLFWLQWWGLPAVHVNLKKLARVLLSFHAICIWLAVCAGPACVQHALTRPDSQFLCCTQVYAILLVWYLVAWLTVPVLYTCVCYTLSVISCGLRFSHILMTVMSMQLVHILHTSPTMSCIPLVDTKSQVCPAPCQVLLHRQCFCVNLQ